MKPSQLRHTKMSTIRKRGMKWQAVVRRRGAAAVSRCFRLRRDALAWAQQKETEFARHAGRSAERAQRVTACEMINRYLSAVLPVKSASDNYKRSQKAQLEYWRARIGAARLSDISPAMLSETKDALIKAGKSPATVNRYLSAISHVFTVAAGEWGYCDGNPLREIKRLREPQGRVRFLSEDERARLFAACAVKSRYNLRLIIALAVSTGARKSEILNLRVADVLPGGEKIVLAKTKNGEGRTLFVSNGPLADAVERQARARAGREFLFSPARADVAPDITREWYAILRAAKLRNLRFHDLRHCFASYLAMNGEPLNVIAALLGHKNIKQTMRYAHLTRNHAEQSALKMQHEIIRYAEAAA